MSDLDPFRKQETTPIAPMGDVGDSVAGKIVKVEYRQDTDLATGQPKTFPDGKPKHVVIVHLDVNGEQVRDFVKGRAVREFRQKVWAVEGEDEGPKPGAHYKREIVRIDPPKRPGFSGEKVSEITYSSPDTRELI